MTGAMDKWIGQSVASYVGEFGNPTSSVKLDDQTSAFRWLYSGQGPGAVVPVMGTLMVVPPRQLQCTVVFKATSNVQNPELKDFTIKSYEWQGNC